ncbi:TPA: sigma-70 region 4 domain-containing protein [Clostridium botulinum]|nr:sigma-70 region 4 domain-containing protein [Clostridium botulinum]
MGKKFTLNKKELEELIKKYTVKELVDITGYGESTLYAHLNKHNLITKKRRDYTKEELIYLEEKWGAKSVKAISRKLNRSEWAVRMKAYKMGLGDPKLSIDGITINQLSKAIGVHYQSIMRNWVEQYGFPVKNKVLINESIAYATQNDFWEWAKDNKNLIDFSRIEENILGKEPQWAKEKRRIDILANNKSRNKRPWTDSEIEKLISLLKTYNFTYADIAERLGRSESAVKRKIYDLKIPYRPVPKRRGVFWTKDQKVKLKELYDKGYTPTLISKTIGKSEFSIYEKLRAMEG